MHSSIKQNQELRRQLIRLGFTETLAGVYTCSILEHTFKAVVGVCKTTFSVTKNNVLKHTVTHITTSPKDVALAVAEIVKSMTEINPDHPIVYVLKKFPKNTSPSHIAEVLDVDPEYYDEMLKKNPSCGLTYYMCYRLSLYFSTSLDLWLNVQRIYDMHIVKEDVAHIKQEIKALRNK